MIRPEVQKLIGDVAQQMGELFDADDPKVDQAIDNVCQVIFWCERRRPT